MDLIGPGNYPAIQIASPNLGLFAQSTTLFCFRKTNDQLCFFPIRPRTCLQGHDGAEERMLAAGANINAATNKGTT